VPDGVRLYAVGDIHGRADLLDDLHGQIAGDAERAPGRRRVVVYLGDYVDRGPDSQGVVEGLIERPLPGFECVQLKGNHEAFLLAFIDDAEAGDAWMMNGGESTLASYGVDTVGYGDDALERARLAFIRALPSSHLDFFRGLALTFDAGDYLFVHAGIRPGVGLRRQKDVDLMWIRDDFLESDADFGHVVVHGHSIRPEPDIRPNRIGIDTGAHSSGRLTCLVLEAGTRRFLHT
jgi:serine/threonine protein phosphatase 1